MALIGLLVVVVIVALIWGLPAWTYARSHEDTDDAFVDGDVVQIAPKVAGQVLRVHALDNQIVHKGDLLVEIDPADYQVAVQSAQANLDQAEEQERATRLNVRLTETTTGAGVQQAQAGVDEARGAVAASNAAVETARSQVDAANAAVQSSRARFTEAQQEVSTARRNAEQQVAAVHASVAEAQRTAEDLRRYQALFAQDAVSQQVLDQSRAAARVAHANLAAAQVRVASLQSQIAEKTANVGIQSEAVRQAEAQADTARTQVAEAQARSQQTRSTVGEAAARLANAESAPQQVAVSRQNVRTVSTNVQAAKAALDAAKLRLAYTRIVAPSDGRVTKKAIEAGQVVQVGQNMMALVSPDVWVTANFKETQLENMRKGAPVDIRVDAYPDQKFSGHVDSIQAGSGAAFSLLPPENATGNYVKVVQRVPVKIVFDSIPPDIVLGPGMSVVPYVSVR
jgi:membrane fusion protein (multidrug efflux system)